MDLSQVPNELQYSAGVAKAPNGAHVFIECKDGFNLRIPTTAEAVRRYNAFKPMKRALEHFAIGNEDKAREFMEIAEERSNVNFFDTKG